MREMKKGHQYEDNLTTYIQSLKNTSINFVFMMYDEIRMKTTAKMLGPDHYVTSAYKNMYYVYVYKESSVKYFITRYQDNVDPIKILNFRPTISEDELGHPYVANHGDHLSFGIRHYSDREFKIDTHETVYEFLQNKHKIGYFAKIIGSDGCTFEFHPNINKKYETFLKIPCNGRKNCTISDSYENETNKRIIFHLVNKMNQVDVPIANKPKTKVGGATTSIQHQTFEYKGYHFFHDDFLFFLQMFTKRIGTYVGISMFYDSAYKNIICFVDFEEISRICLAIHLPKALKACYAFIHPKDASKRDTKILQTFTTQFDIKIAKIKKYIYNEDERV